MIHQNALRQLGRNRENMGYSPIRWGTVGCIEVYASGTPGFNGGRLACGSVRPTKTFEVRFALN
jgi:hypothetical protein